MSADLSRFGSLVLTRQVLDWTADAEKNAPYLRTWDSFGKRKDDLVTSEGWRRLQELGQAEGIIAISYENKNGPYSRVHQFLKYIAPSFLWENLINDTKIPPMDWLVCFCHLSFCNDRWCSKSPQPASLQR